MKTFEIEGVRLTENMIEDIKYLQEGKGVENYLKLTDRIVRFVAMNGNENLNDKEQKDALGIISELYFLREMLHNFLGMEESL